MSISGRGLGKPPGVGKQQEMGVQVCLHQQKSCLRGGADAAGRCGIHLDHSDVLFRSKSSPVIGDGAGDALGASFANDRLGFDFVPVPVEQPRGRAGESTGEYPVYEPEGDAGDGTGAGDPGSALSSGTETLADGLGPERAEDEPERGRKSQGLPRLLKELLKEIEKAPRGIDQETEQDALQEGSHPTLPVSDSGTQAAPTAGTPGMNAGKSTEAAVHQSARKRYIAAVVMFPAAVLACGAVIWMCKTYLVCKREERAAEPAHPDTN
ncbi:uncharacterized protein LOC128088517 [Tympanuchus pallidicinctus]|uniref:uncharacterized protein LOC128088517 n=1 Tax=Tympanuchus pallidicinctus TaxID=109042 RepID=UPI002286F629|nr:uncharacterized protein LOC128088517 [Tympanuchus pallidicinctus]